MAPSEPSNSNSPPSASSSPTLPQDSSDLVPDSTFYTWSTFFRILTSTASPVETKQYFLNRDIAREESDCARCEKHRDYLLEYSPTIRFLRKEIRALGPHHDLNSENIRCRRCTTNQSGGFDSEYGILLCANQMRDRSHVEDTMAHEMVHGYDHLRFWVDRTNLRHQACTEIRASTLSGECRFTKEFFTRKQYKITEQLQECVRRRATLSLSARPECKDDAHAARIVNEVWDSCFKDTRPFDEIYR